MVQDKVFLLIFSTIIAAIPAGIWLYIFFGKTERSKKVLAAVFGLGCLTAPALLLLQVLWQKFPRFDLATFIETSITQQSAMFVATFVLFGAMEEIIKLYVVNAVDKKTLLIQKIDDSIRYSLAAALGFSFTENIYYLIQFWPVISTGELIGMYIFRSIFTAAAHMIFSGVFGFYYGLGKFSIYLREHRKQVGKSQFFNRFISKIFRIPLSHSYQQRMVVKGLFISILMHATYNFLLQYNIILPVLIFVILGFAYVQYLLSRKAGHLILATDISTKKTSTMAKKDEDVIIELLGMWFKDKRYVDVIHICERLLERDPDNNIVKIFKARALDRMDKNDIYRKILGTVMKSSDERSSSDNSKLTKYIHAKEKLQKSKGRNSKEDRKKELELRKKRLEEIEAQKRKIQTIDQDPKSSKTGDDTFDIK